MIKIRKVSTTFPKQSQHPIHCLYKGPQVLIMEHHAVNLSPCRDTATGQLTSFLTFVKPILPQPFTRVIYLCQPQDVNGNKTVHNKCKWKIFIRFPIVPNSCKVCCKIIVSPIFAVCVMYVDPLISLAHASFSLKYM